MLVDADNMPARRLQPVLDAVAALAAAGRSVAVIASGRPAVLDRLSWPPGTVLLASSGWQRADVALADAYRPSGDPLVLVTGDGDFALLAARHPGPVLVVSDAASGRLREAATVVDPVRDGTAGILDWVTAVTNC